MNILKKIIKEGERLALSEFETYGTPLKQHIELSRRKAIELAEKLGANKEVIEIGTLMMDSKIGQAIKEGRQSEHVTMSHEFTKELLNKYSDLDEATRLNIEACVLEHHGKEKFSTLEAEICCNADCYRFCSVEGTGYVLRYFRAMEFKDLTALINMKLEEKWNALSIDICKKELEPQYKILKDFMSYLKT